MNHTFQNIEALFAFLFAIRIYLQDDYDNEDDIIKELKKQAQHVEVTNLNEELGSIDQIIFGFYQYYDINISLEQIQNVNITDNINNEDYMSAVELLAGLQINTTTNINEINIGTVPINNHNNMFNAINTLLTGLINYENQDILEDVIVTLDDSELDKLKSTKVESNTDVTCSICLNQVEENEYLTELKCSHKFHSNCIKKYLSEYSCKCPVCRCEVGKPKYNI